MYTQNDIHTDYLAGRSLGRVFSQIKQAVYTTAKCESGKLQAGAKMPKMKKKKEDKKRRAPAAQDRLPPVPAFDGLGGVVNMLQNQMMMLQDGMDLSMTNVIADNGNMNIGVQGDSYFTLRHSLAFDGPLGFLMTGGQRDYSVECIAQKGKENTMVANWIPSQGTMDGQWEYKWSKNLSHMFQFTVTSSSNPRLLMMLPNYSGKVCWQNSFHNLSLGKAQNGSLYFSTLHRCLPNLLMGTKFSLAPDSGVGHLILGGQYKIRGTKPGDMETLECKLGAKTITAIYARQLSKRATLAAKCDYQIAQKSATSSFYYKYLFGSENQGTQIMGEITSKATCRFIYMMPFLQRFMLRAHGEMNHFDFNPKLGQVPHKFGFSIMMQM